MCGDRQLIWHAPAGRGLLRPLELVGSEFARSTAGAEEARERAVRKHRLGLIAERELGTLHSVLERTEGTNVHDRSHALPWLTAVDAGESPLDGVRSDDFLFALPRDFLRAPQRDHSRAGRAEVVVHPGAEARLPRSCRRKQAGMPGAECLPEHHADEPDHGQAGQDRREAEGQGQNGPREGSCEDKDGNLGISDMKLHVLISGDKFDMKTRKVIK